MLDDIKKEFSSLKLLTALATIALAIYLFQFVIGFIRNFEDILLILVFGWLLSFILEPLVDVFTGFLRVPRTMATALVFVLIGVLITLSFILFIPDITSQFKTLETVVPAFLNNAPSGVQVAVNGLINSLNNFSGYLPSITQFLINLVTILILSFYLIVDKENLSKKIFRITPTKYHESMRFVQSVIDKSFASFVRIQLIWGLIGGVLTWIILTIFGVNFAASTSLMAGILTAVPMIGPIIGVIPPLLVALIEKPDQAIFIFVVLFLIQQFIFNVFGPKLLSKAFNINPIIVMFSLLIGIKIAGFTGAVFAIPVVSILSIVGREFYNYYFKDND